MQTHIAWLPIIRRRGEVMYVIEDKKGRFFTPWTTRKGTRDLWVAYKYTSKKRALKECARHEGERVFEVHLTLGKQVK
jgi:hypothetical protein